MACYHEPVSGFSAGRESGLPMKWITFLAALVGAGVYFGYIPLPSPGELRATLAGMTNLAPREWAIEHVEDAVLKPLESGKIVSTDSAKSSIQSIRAVLSSQPQNADSARQIQALRLLEQALQERNAILAQIQKGAPTNHLDEVPGHWHVINHPEQPIDPTAEATKLRTSFWAQAALNRWRERSAYYKAAIDSLLSQPTPAN